MKAQKIYLEHANITVNNLQESIHFFQTAFPHFKIRGGGNDRRKWVHLGNDITYIAINQATEVRKKRGKDMNKSGINHIGFVVENIEEITDRLLQNGFKRNFPKAIEEFRIRDYFADSDGNEFEFIQYLSDKIEERNSFE